MSKLLFVSLCCFGVMMSKFQVFLSMDGKDKETYVAARRIREFDGTRYLFPEEHHEI